MWILGVDFNVVTLTAIILALGLLLDDTVVVMENIERHYRELKRDIESAVYGGTEEIMFADLSGTLTTMIALAPMLFIGGYPGDSFCPTCWNSSFSSSSVIYNLYSCSSILSLKILSIQNRFILSLEEWF